MAAFLITTPVNQKTTMAQTGSAVSSPSISGFRLLRMVGCADFQVTKSLSGVSFDPGRNWAGSIGVNRPGLPNNTLFFWGFEKEHGSLTAKAGERKDESWGIWLNGGCVLVLFCVGRCTHRSVVQVPRVCWAYSKRYVDPLPPRPISLRVAERTSPHRFGQLHLRQQLQLAQAR
jgi:hypothetical protein